MNRRRCRSLSTRGTLAKWRPNRAIRRRGWALIEFHRRFALSTACLVLALVGIPLGLSSKKGGKSSGFVLTIPSGFCLLLRLFGGSFLCAPREGFARIRRVAGGHRFLFGRGILAVAGRTQAVRYFWLARTVEANDSHSTAVSRSSRREDAFEPAHRRGARFFSARFPMILDDYVLRDFATNLILVLATFLLLLLVFTLFELLGDILRNQISQWWSANIC